MANAQPPRPPSRKRPKAGAQHPRKLAGVWTPDRARRQWELHHPERPEVAAALERLYRLSH
ncbi:MAG TPA: hypothetical protein V6D47_13085 [Oscillatoriaceae cyanobacterium]